MKPITIASLALLMLALSALAGCHADPHDTHVAAPVVAPR
jgi:hypothetical protein